MPYWTVWAKPVGGGAVAAIALNSADSGVDVDVSLAALGFAEGSNVSAIDVWTGNSAGIYTGTWTIASLPMHASQFLLFTPVAPDN